MRTNKEKMRESVAVLSETAADAAELAKVQRRTADEQNDTAIAQHATAHKLEELSENLAKEAADLEENLETSAKSDDAAAAVPAPTGFRRRA